MIRSALSLALMDKELISAAEASCWAWRIQNDYPPELRAAAEAWAQEEAVPSMEVTGITLEQVRRMTGEDVPHALEFLYVISRDPVEGRDVLARSTLRDSLR